jgi:hypothetical protein
VIALDPLTRTLYHGRQLQTPPITTAPIPAELLLASLDAHPPREAVIVGTALVPVLGKKARLTKP